MFKDSTTFISTSFPKHAKYKPSGVDWLGEVPEHWQLISLRNVLTEVSEKGFSELPLLSITRELGIIERDVDDQEGNHNFIPPDLSGYKRIKQGNFGMNKMKAWQGSYGVSDFTGIVSPAYFVYSLNDALVPSFFHWAVRSKVYVGEMAKSSDGVRIGQWDLSKQGLKEIRLAVPINELEQKAIVNFLDAKTKEIEEAIKQKQHTIELLEEYKHSLIEQAVTKGLDPSVPMKDSGVDWLGEVPNSWAIKPLRNSFSERRETVSALDFTPLSVSKAGVTMQLESAVKSADPSNRKLVRKGDFAINSRSDRKGSSGTSELTGSVSTVVTVLIPRREMIPSYAHHLFRSNAFKEEFFRNGHGIHWDLWTTRFSDMKNILVPVPSEETQFQIANFLDAKTKEIEEAKSSIQVQIDHLKEYKDSLIESAVTGKIKVA